MGKFTCMIFLKVSNIIDFTMIYIKVLEIKMRVNPLLLS